MGGFLLARPWPPWSWVDSTRLPPAIITASDCLGAMSPEPALLPWGQATEVQQTAALAAMGLVAAQLHSVMDWIVTQQALGNWGLPNIFASPSIARGFLDEFRPSFTDLRILGLAMPDRDVDDYLAGQDPPRSEQAWTFGLVDGIRRGQRPPPGGTALGYEILGAEYGGGFHSWYCNNLEPIVHERLGIIVNEDGLVDGLDAAVQATELVASDEIGSEPVWWQTWLLVDYSSVAKRSIQLARKGT
jgi:hypothetical protein